MSATTNGTPEAPELEREDHMHLHFSCSVCSKVYTKSKSDSLYFQLTMSLASKLSFLGCLNFVELSRTRHVLYCRQKQLKQNRNRKKLCTLCRHAKTTCSEKIPQCARCKAKGLECKYDGDQGKESALQIVGHNNGESREEGRVDHPASIAEPVVLPAWT